MQIHYNTGTPTGVPGKKEILKIENGNANVVLADQTTKPLDALFARSLSEFTITAPITASGVEPASFTYSFTASAGHGIAPGDEILLLDTVGDRSFYSEVVTTVANVITVDRPIDWDFPLATLGRIVETNMAVDGSVTPVAFSLRAGDIPVDSTRFIITMTDDTSMDDGKFGGLAALTRGLVFRIVNSFQKTIFCFKTNGEIAQFCYDTKYPDKAPAGVFGFNARITFGGQAKHGVVLRIQDDDVLQWVPQDDLRGLLTLRVAAEGHDTQGENI
jgi:hypothetical protein